MTLNLTAIGNLFGVSSHVVGQWLREIGLRKEDGKPSSAAFQGNFVSQAPLAHGGYYWVWDADKTIEALQQAGHEMAQEAVAKIAGPFSMVENGHNAFQILSGDGTVAIWVIGQENADFVTRILNLACKHGRLGEHH